MNIKHKNVLVNLNRALIFVLAAAGLLIDGYQVSDLLCALSLIIWLWMPLCMQIELKTLKRFQRYARLH